jgi:hypothetical protein
VPIDLRAAVDQVLVIGDLPCSAIATRASGTMVTAVGANRDAALRRLHARLRRDDRGARHARPLGPQWSA